MTAKVSPSSAMWKVYSANRGASFAVLQQESHHDLSLLRSRPMTASTLASYSPSGLLVSRQGSVILLTGKIPLHVWKQTTGDSALSRQCDRSRRILILGTYFMWITAAFSILSPPLMTASNTGCARPFSTSRIGLNVGTCTDCIGYPVDPICWIV